MDKVMNIRSLSVSAWQPSPPALVEECFLVEPKSIPPLWFWRAEVVLQHSPLPPLYRPSGLMPCPPELNPSVQPPTCQQHEADLQIVQLSPNNPVPVWCGNQPRPAVLVCPPGQQGFGWAGEVGPLVLAPMLQQPVSWGYVVESSTDALHLWCVSAGSGFFHCGSPPRLLLSAHRVLTGYTKAE